MAKKYFLGLTAFAVIGLAQEGGEINFDMMTICYNQQLIRLDIALMAYGVWRWIGWLAGRDHGEPRVAIPTALTAVFALGPYDLSWIVNPPAMIWLGLVGEATPWAAVTMVWLIGFVTMTAMEHLSRRAELVRLRLEA